LLNQQKGQKEGTDEEMSGLPKLQGNWQEE
jgi:hypothetical protein